VQEEEKAENLYRHKMFYGSSGSSFSYNERLHKNSDFKKIFEHGVRLSVGFANIFIFNRKDGKPIKRLGLVTSKKVGIAVERNKAKRRIREIFRTGKNKLVDGLDIIFVLKSSIKFQKYSFIEQKIFDTLKSAGYCKE